MYLTRLQLDPSSAMARRDLADPYDMHRTLVRAFVREGASQVPRFLWRLEPDGAWSHPVVLVQSEHSADWSYLVGRAGYLRDGGQPATKALDPVTLLAADARYRFRLIANPTVTREGRRLGLVGETAQLSWLNRQGERAGFGVQAALVTGSEVSHGREDLQGEGDTRNRISLLRVCFEGALRVRDVRALARALTAGIGPGKAFGCGLLSLALCS